MESINFKLAAENYFNSEATLKANAFIDKIKRGEIKKDILPNTFPDFTGEEEYKDYFYYNKFLNSRAGVFFMNALK